MEYPQTGRGSDTKLLRDELSKALRELGYPVSTASLATMATRGGGPPYRKFGRVPLYTWGEALDWVNARLSMPRRSTSEADVMSEAGASRAQNLSICRQVNQ